MLNDIKKRNSEFLKKYFEETFAEDHEVDFNWGFPTSQIKIQLKKENKINIWLITFNIENGSFDLSCYAEEENDGIKKPLETNISSDIIHFIISKTAEITEKFFIKMEEKESADENQNKVDKE